MSNAVVFALVCALIALVYGGWSIGWILAKPAGTVPWPGSLMATAT